MVIVKKNTWIVADCVPHGDAQPAQYELIETVGSGGMATVYKAREIGTDRLVAIKYPHAEKIISSKEFFDRFLREAKFARSIRHPNVIKIFDLGIDADGQPFQIMELLADAEPLSDIIKRHYDAHYFGGGSHRKIKGSLVPLMELALPIYRQILVGLGALHQKGIIHRDIKPDNVLVSFIDGEPHVTILDFGVAKDLHPSSEEQNLTHGLIVGTAHYLSPEHIRPRFHPTTGEPWPVGPTSDFWSATVILYEMVAGEVPFQHESIELLMGLIVDESNLGRPKAVSTYVKRVNPGLVALFEICFAKYPWERPQTVEAVLGLLEPIIICDKLGKKDKRSAYQTSRESAYRKSVSEITIFRPTRMRLWTMSIVVFIVIVAVGITAYIFTHGPSSSSLQKPNASVPTATARAAIDKSISPATSVAGQSITSSVPQVASGKRMPGSGPTKAQRAAYRTYHKGLIAAARGACRTAVIKMNITLVRYPSFPLPFKILGDCARRRGHFIEAQRYYVQYQRFNGVKPLPTRTLMFLARRAKKK